MPNNRKKSLKDIKGERIHPFSRKASQMSRAVNRSSKLKSDKTARFHSRVEPMIERFLWFKYVLESSSAPVPLDEIHSLISLYISRNDMELADLISSHTARFKNSKRPLPARVDLMKALKEKDEQEYKMGGFEVPDLRDVKTVDYLVGKWEGDPNALSKIKTARFIKPETRISTVGGDVQQQEMEMQVGQ